MIIYPFSAIVGQEQMQLALLLNAVNPAIGGVLIRGQKGTAKSTAARALATLLPTVESSGLMAQLRTSAGTESIPLYPPETTSKPAPFIDLPLGASDDRVVGTLDIEQALQHGQRRFEAGLLAQAHQGILYVDEVNLLADHVVDVLLDVAASGRNTVEREGISVTHPAKFILVGTMNPEEGDLRPQLLDRFGLAVEVVGQPEPTVRKQIVKRRLAYEADPNRFETEYAATDQAMREKIVQARTRLPQVELSEAMLDMVTHICAGSGVDGLRADIIMCKTAQTLAAWEDDDTVTVDHIRRSAELVLLHRRRRQPFEEPGLDQEQLDDLINQSQQNNQSNQSRESHDDSEGE
ncbi:ATP-binding protein [Anaerolineales bacterium HSG6]|nr:ATP-binding protein [Anaerolineales bacterium HSG6]